MSSQAGACVYSSEILSGGQVNPCGHQAPSYGHHGVAGGHQTPSGGHQASCNRQAPTQEIVLQWMETSNMLQVAELVIAAALQRCESRGSHWRRDYEKLDETLTNCHYALVRATLPETLDTPLKKVIAHA